MTTHEFSEHPSSKFINFRKYPIYIHCMYILEINTCMHYSIVLFAWFILFINNNISSFALSFRIQPSNWQLRKDIWGQLRCWFPRAQMSIEVMYATQSISEFLNFWKIQRFAKKQNFEKPFQKILKIFNICVLCLYTLGKLRKIVSSVCKTTGIRISGSRQPKNKIRCGILINFRLSSLIFEEKKSRFRFRFIDKMKTCIHYNSSDLLIVKTNQGQATGLQFSLWEISKV